MFNTQEKTLFDTDQKTVFFLPFLLSFFLIIIMVSPYCPVYIRIYLFCFPLIPFYFWAVNYKLSALFLYAFLIGLFQDFLLANAIGLWISFYLSAALLIRYFSRLSRKMEWFESCLAFGLTLLIALMIIFLASIIVYEHINYIFPLLKSALATIICYPVLQAIFLYYKAKNKTN